MNEQLWTPEQFQEKVMNSSEEYCFMTGTALGPVDYYYRKPFDGNELETIHVCAEPTIGYDIRAFNGNAIETLNTADYTFWSLLVVSQDALTEEMLSVL